MTTRKLAIRSLAFAGYGLVAACGEDAAPSVDYYRRHPAQWEREVWICTNEPAIHEHIRACASALEALPMSGDGASDANKSQSCDTHCPTTVFDR